MARLLNIVNVIQQLEEAEEENTNKVSRVQRYAERSDPFDFPDRYFKKIFRLDKDSARNLIDNLKEFLLEASRSSALTPETKVLTTLSFLASGSYQMNVGSISHFCISQPSVSRGVSEVVAAINTHLFDKWVKFDMRQPSLLPLRRGFYEKFDFPGIIGAIDFTHMAIVAPPVYDPVHKEQDYFNHKGYHSLNVQLVCDSDLNILNVNARYPESVHDSHIFRHSRLRASLQENERLNPHQKVWLLGDSGYGLESFLLTPVPGEPDENTPQGRYNARHRSTRNVIERCIGVLKARWRCLLKHRVLHYYPPKASEIVKACTVLNNMCIANNIVLDEEIPWEELEIDQHHLNDMANVAGGENIRNYVINQYFS